MRLSLTVTMLVAATVAANGQSQAPVPPSLTSAPPPQVAPVPNPDPLPSPPDLRIPDLSTLPSAPDKSKSRAKRALDRITPRCLDGITHSCWSSPPGGNTPLPSKEERQFAEDMDIGSFHLKNKNWRGAEFRFRDALSIKPDHPIATFKLAQSLDKLGNTAASRAAFQAYLRLEPDGVFAAQARKAIERLK